MDNTEIAQDISLEHQTAINIEPHVNVKFDQDMGQDAVTPTLQNENTEQAMSGTSSAEESDVSKQLFSCLKVKPLLN